MNEMFKEYSKLLDNSEQHLSYETLATYYHMKDQLSLKETSFVDHHIENCDSCRKNLDLIINEDKEIDPGKLSGPKIFKLPQFVKYAVAASLIIAVGTIFYLSNITQPDKNYIVDTKVEEEKFEEQLIDTLKIAKDEIEELDEKIKSELSIDNQELYAVNIVLENFIERNLRSDKKLKIMMPSIDDDVKLPIKLQWERYNYDGEVELEIVDNKNRKQFSAKVVGESIIIDEKLNEGLYYWKIKADGRLADIGKFKIM